MDEIYLEAIIRITPRTPQHLHAPEPLKDEVRSWLESLDVAVEHVAVRPADARPVSADPAVLRPGDRVERVERGVVIALDSITDGRACGVQWEHGIQELVLTADLRRVGEEV